MSLTLIIGKCQNPPNKITKTYTATKTYENVVFKTQDGVSQKNPVFLIQADLSDIRWCNYAELRDTSNKTSGAYFIDDFKSVRNGLVEVHCTLDALATYKSNILNARAYVDRGEHGYNLYMQDPYIDVLSYVSLDTKKLGDKLDSTHFVGLIIGE